MPNVIQISNRVTYSSPGAFSWAFPAGLEWCYATLVGGGQGGTGVTASVGAAGRGGNVLYRARLLIPIGDTTIDGTVGAGGAGGAPGSAGSAGGTTTVGILEALGGGVRVPSEIGDPEGGLVVNGLVVPCGYKDAADLTNPYLSNIGVMSIFQPPSVRRVAAGAPTAGTFGGGGGGGAFSASAAPCGGASWGPGGIGGFGTGVNQAGAAGGVGAVIFEW